MEDLNRREEKRKFFEFADAIEQRVNDIGAQRASRARAADAVIERLYKFCGGDASKVTDEQIVDAFDVVEEKRD